MKRIGGTFKVTCVRADGSIRWEDTAKNLVPTEGLGVDLDQLFSLATQVSAWYVGLVGATPTIVAGDTAASHAGWVEVTAYDETARPLYDPLRTGLTVSNAMSTIVFTMGGSSGSIGGAFVASMGTKGGTAGKLLCVAAFGSGDKAYSAGEALRIQYDFTASDDGA
jgi:hypothetical protein